MDLYQALQVRLLAPLPISSRVGTRVDWDERPQGNALPAITLQLVSLPRDTKMEEDQRLLRAVVQVDIWGAKRAAVAALVQPVIDAIEPAVASDGIEFSRSFAAGQRDTSERPDAGGTIFRTSIDFAVWHART